MAQALPMRISIICITNRQNLSESVYIQASITEGKVTEFEQSKQLFLEGLKTVDGYLGYTETPGKTFSLSIAWENREKLDCFMNSELYSFFHGALLTLGILQSLTVRSEKKISN